MASGRLERERLAVVVLNDARAVGRRDLRNALAEAASRSGWAAPLVLSTTPDDSGGGMTRQAVAAGADLVIAVGGDGTVRACAQELAGTDVPLAVIPAGAANLTARALRIPRGLTAALAVAFHGSDRRIDVACAGGVVCTAMAGIGVDAAVVGATPDRLKQRAGWPAYAATALGQLFAAPVEFTVRLDGGTAFSRMARCVVVGNTGQLPGGFPILPDAQPDDGVLDVAILAPGGLAGWASIGSRAVIGSRRDDARLERYQARQVDISAGRELPRQVDGEITGSGDSLSVTIRPGALLVRVPRTSPASAGAA